MWLSFQDPRILPLRKTFRRSARRVGLRQNLVCVLELADQWQDACGPTSPNNKSDLLTILGILPPIVDC
jgi:hypothetical protein